MLEEIRKRCACEICGREGEAAAEGLNVCINRRCLIKHFAKYAPEVEQFWREE